MSLSSNWKALSSRIAPKDDKKPKSLSSKTKAANAKPSKVGSKNDKPPYKTKSIPSGHVDGSELTTQKNLMGPLEYALWTSSKHGGEFKIEKFSELKAVAFKNPRKQDPGKYVAIDCEFVGIGENRSALARVSIVNYYGVVQLDTFVKPREKVTDWRTWVSGVTSKDMHHAITFKEAQKKVDELIRNRIVVGHALQNDMKSLALTVDRRSTRDTSKFAKFRQMANGRAPALKKLCHNLLDLQIQGASHSSVEDARAAMALYRLHQKEMDQASR